MRTTMSAKEQIDFSYVLASAMAFTFTAALALSYWLSPPEPVERDAPLPAIVFQPASDPFRDTVSWPYILRTMDGRTIRENTMVDATSCQRIVEATAAAWQAGAPGVDVQCLDGERNVKAEFWARDTINGRLLTGAAMLDLIRDHVTTRKAHI